MAVTSDPSSGVSPLPLHPDRGPPAILGPMELLKELTPVLPTEPTSGLEHFCGDLML